MAKKHPLVLCFGEFLWDSLPDGLYPGGASFNVAYHLHHQGLTTCLVSAVGRDFLGDELIRRMEKFGLPTQGVARLKGWPTGTVLASVGPGGDAKFDIATDVAWDRIPAAKATLRAAARADAIVFGTLSQRSERDRATLARLLGAARGGALKIFDVNLRPPHDDLGAVRALAPKADLLKVNAGEAAKVAAGAAESAGREEGDARRLAEEFGIPIVCVTAGARGAGLLRRGRWTWERGRPVRTADTVGAGDAFLAALTAGLLFGGKRPDAALLARACRLGEWVAGQRGATPVYGSTLANLFQRKTRR